MTDDTKNQNNSYCLKPVPETEWVSGWKVAQVVFGIGITLPVFWLGANTTLSLGLPTALLLFFIVNSLFGCLTVLTALVGSRTHLSTYMILKFSFGRIGSRLINLIMAVTFLGFYAATVSIFGETVAIAFQDIFDINTPIWLHMIWGSVLMTVTSIYGFRAMDRLSLIAVPLLLLFMILVIGLALSQAGETVLAYQPQGGSISEMASALIGMMILTVVMMPDFSRFARSDRGAVQSIAGLVVGFPVVLIAGGIPAIVIGQLEVMDVMVALGLSVPAVFVLVFSTWTTNTANIYSTALTVRTVFTGLSTTAVHIICSTLATVLALKGFITLFLDFIILLSIVLPPVASIYVLDFFLIRKQNYKVELIPELPNFGWPAIIAWGSSVVVSFLTLEGVFTLTSLPIVDGLLVSLIGYYILVRKGGERSRARTLMTD
ncbi:purine-cytosine permease family protein [Parendozoicomonas haliclonae]|uniref:Cytosine permease n=1 Tax=Parendozoicomonas haliclonae TaxID=1960125 RepID=A0A1X7ARZ7_9GAMM|nr:cytosine permease [Parendozoicomonas haliclonae]SMA50912.1 Cytosine permease [Parendozoicomonas haliclonae]